MTTTNDDERQRKFPEEPAEDCARTVAAIEAAKQRQNEEGPSGLRIRPDVLIASYQAYNETLAAEVKTLRAGRDDNQNQIAKLSQELKAVREKRGAAKLAAALLIGAIAGAGLMYVFGNRYVLTSYGGMMPVRMNRFTGTTQHFIIGQGWQTDEPSRNAGGTP